MEFIKPVMVSGLLLIGAIFMLLAAIGITRMPDVFTRMQPATKAATLGVGFMLLAVAFHFETVGASARAVAIITFVALTSPVAAHLIGRAAYVLGVPLYKGTEVDELGGCYDPVTHELCSEPARESIARKGH